MFGFSLPTQLKIKHLIIILVLLLIGVLFIYKSKFETNLFHTNNSGFGSVVATPSNIYYVNPNIGLTAPATNKQNNIASINVYASTDSKSTTNYVANSSVSIPINYDQVFVWQAIFLGKKKRFYTYDRTTLTLQSDTDDYFKTEAGKYQIGYSADDQNHNPAITVIDQQGSKITDWYYFF